jgi:hypothetical protein
MKGKWVLEGNTIICMAAPKVQFFTYRFNEE